MSTVPVILRHATLNDLPRILEVFTQSIIRTASADYSKEQVQAWLLGAENIEGWTRRIASQYFIVAISGTDIIGFGSIEKDYLDLMFVHPDFIRQGIATKICRTLIDYAVARNEIRIHTHASITARSFFESIGFTVIRVNRFDLNGTQMFNYVMHYAVPAERN